MLNPDWIEHRRGDGELLGWMSPEGEEFVPIDLLGRPLTDPVDWLAAEEVLEAVGIGYLADPYELKLDDGQWLRVRVTEVSTDPHSGQERRLGRLRDDATGLHPALAAPRQPAPTGLVH